MFQDSPEDNRTRLSTDILVHKRVLSLLLALVTADKGGEQHAEIARLLDVLRAALLNNVERTIESNGFPSNVRNLMAANITDEVDEIKEAAQIIAQNLRGS